MLGRPDLGQVGAGVAGGEDVGDGHPGFSHAAAAPPVIDRGTWMIHGLPGPVSSLRPSKRPNHSPGSSRTSRAWPSGARRTPGKVGAEGHESTDGRHERHRTVPLDRCVQPAADPRRDRLPAPGQRRELLLAGHGDRQIASGDEQPVGTDVVDLAPLHRPGGRPGRGRRRPRTESRSPPRRAGPAKPAASARRADPVDSRRRLAAEPLASRPLIIMRRTLGRPTDIGHRCMGTT